MKCFTSVENCPTMVVTMMGGVEEYNSPPTLLQEVGLLVVGPGGKKEGGRAAVSLPELASGERGQVQRAKKYAMEQSIKIVLMKQTLAHQQAQAKSLQKQQAIVLMCRIYVGSINFEVGEEQLKTMFGPFGPLKSVSMSWDPISQKHKGQDITFSHNTRTYIYTMIPCP